METRLRIAVLFGGRSGEHEVSLRSAAAIAVGLGHRHEIVPVFVDKAGGWHLRESIPGEGGVAVFLVPSPSDGGRLRRLSDGAVVSEPELFFPMLHGTYGEDGTVQGLLELAGIPYVGSGVAGSAAAMDKALMKSLFQAHGLPQTPWRLLRERSAEAEERAIAELGLPVFVKPANLGSSVGVSRVDGPEGLEAALRLAFAFDRRVVLEAGVDAREVEVGVVGNEHPEASLPGEVVPDRSFYDYDSKYDETSSTRLLIPAPLPPSTSEEIRQIATQAFLAVDGAGFSRVDFFVERGSGRILLNEINTIPGFTSISMFPKLWEATGVPFGDLVERLITLGMERHRARGALRTEMRG
jgi:D-alanine-D-alanine ligase